LEENNLTKRQVIESVAQKLCNKFPNNVSASQNCQRQNFNRDNLISMLSNLDVDYFTPNLDVKIYQSLLGINNEASIYVKEHKIVTPKKCDYYKFWLFYLEPETILAKIRNDLN
jgi:hypothetical protein